MDHLRANAHRLINHIQVLLSYLETENFDRALPIAHCALKELHVLVSAIAGIPGQQHMKVPAGGAVVVPHDSKVISSDDTTANVPWDDVQAVRGAEILAGHHDVNPRTR